MKFICRSAVPGDAASLQELNTAFNGPGKMDASAIRTVLSTPGGERVFVAEAACGLIGFCCCQIKRSICYETISVEITELFVREGFRRLGVAKELFLLLESSFEGDPLGELHLLTGQDNRDAQKFYESMGFARTDELFYQKEL